MFARGFHSGPLQNITQARTGKTGRAHRAFAPLDAGNLRPLQTASIASALERVDDGVRLHLGQLGKAQRERLLDFSAQRETPAAGIEFARLVHVVAHEEVRHGREPAIEILDRAFQIDEAERAKNHAILAWNRDCLSLREGPGQHGRRCACHKRRP